MQRFVFILILVFALSVFGKAQSAGKVTVPKNLSVQSSLAVKSSSAYAEVLLRKTERTAELEDFLVEYTEEYPKVQQLRAELALLNKEMNRILAVNPSEASKLTLALGKLMLRKVELEMDYANVQKQYTDDHADVKQAKRKVEIFEAAISDILQ